jgi:hypothetical protein
MKISIAVIFTSLALTCCSNITPEQVETVHELYHIVTGEPCKLAQPLYCK